MHRSFHLGMRGYVLFLVMLVSTLLPGAVLPPRSSDGGGAGRKGKALDHKRKKKLRQSGWEKKTATIAQLVDGCVRLIAVITKLAQMLDDWTL
jgi:hypothetical protein